MTSVGPHGWAPYRWWDRLRGLRGRCFHCYTTKLAHPTTEWVPARPLRMYGGWHRG